MYRQPSMKEVEYEWMLRHFGVSAAARRVVPARLLLNVRAAAVVLAAATTSAPEPNLETP